MDEFQISRGSHATPEDGLCTLEVVAMLSGEEHTDQPDCCCPAIGSFCMRWNDDLLDAERTALLLPLTGRLVGSVVDSPDVVRQRATMAVDWLIREQAPAWLGSIEGGAFFARALRGSARVVDGRSAATITQLLGNARAAFAPPETPELLKKGSGYVGRSGGIAAWLDLPALGYDLPLFAAAVSPALSVSISAASQSEDPEEVIATLQGAALDLVDRMLEVR